ncbi:MAG: methyltransferase domain-containing protein [Candidatus Micrarchaeota archaeon]
MIKPYLIGDVLDFGGNEGELKKFVKGKYLVVNYDHSAMENTHFDTIVSLAVIEHIEFDEVFKIFRKFKKILNKGGRILLTTPTKMAKPVLEFWAFLGIVDKKNIVEHKHYWTKKEIYQLADNTGFIVKRFKRFQFGFNQLAILEHK